MKEKKQFPETGARLAWQAMLGLAALAIAAPVFSQNGGQNAPAPATQGATTDDAPAPVNTAYQLGPNDDITVVVYGQNEFNVHTRVKPDGSIVMPLIGRVEASGRTVITLADEIAKRLVDGNYLRDPIVNVEINQYNSRYVRVAGLVGSPGLVPLDRSRHLLDILLRSGWVRPDGSQYITVRHAKGGEEVKIDSLKLAEGGKEDILLDTGDTVYVANAELVYLNGAVARPGPYPLKPDMTIAEAIAQAGGVGPTGSNGKVGLKRGDDKETSVDQNTKLEPGDIVTVKERLF